MKMKNQWLCLFIIFTMACNGMDPVPRPNFEELEKLLLSDIDLNLEETLPTERLAEWLHAAWQAGIEPAKIQLALEDAGWLDSNDDWHVADVTGDGKDEWLVTLYLSPTRVTWGRSGDFWIIGEEGLLFRLFLPEDYFCISFCNSEFHFGEGVPQVIGITDMTGDGLPEIVLRRTMGGAHTITQSYFVLSNHFGSVQNLVELPFDRYRWGDVVTLLYQNEEAKTISMTYSVPVGFEDMTGNGLHDLMIHGGWHGSAASGVQRTRTEVWSWNGAAIALSQVHWDATNYRMHLLWEGNDKYYLGQFDVAGLLFQQVIDDETLQESPYGNQTVHYHSSRFFAAFRLLLIALVTGNEDDIYHWEQWLNEYYHEYPISEAATILLHAWEKHTDLNIACEQVTNYLLDFETPGRFRQGKNPTGSLVDMGYANPRLNTEDVCLILGH
jgi:hypothetical protein